MIIDIILDRQDGVPYNPARFASDCAEYEKIFQFDYGIAEAINRNDDEGAKAAMCRYIDEQDYNPEIKEYVNSVGWAFDARTAK
jgi:hypothetical protein